MSKAPRAVRLDAAGSENEIEPMPLERGVAILPTGTGGYVADAFDGLHPFRIGSTSPLPPTPTGGPYWSAVDAVLVGQALHWFDLERFYAEVRRVDSGYRTLPFPFDELAVPPQTLTTQWTLEQLAGYARSGSATARYRADRGSDPVLWLEAALGPWFPGPGARMRVA